MIVSKLGSLYLNFWDHDHLLKSCRMSLGALYEPAFCALRSGNPMLVYVLVR